MCDRCDEEVFLFIDCNGPGIVYRGNVAHFEGLLLEGGCPTRVKRAPVFGAGDTGVMCDPDQVGQPWPTRDAPNHWAVEAGVMAARMLAGDLKEVRMMVRCNCDAVLRVVTPRATVLNEDDVGPVGHAGWCPLYEPHDGLLELCIGLRLEALYVLEERCWARACPSPRSGFDDGSMSLVGHVEGPGGWLEWARVCCETDRLGWEASSEEFPHAG